MPSFFKWLNVRGANMIFACFHVHLYRQVIHPSVMETRLVFGCHCHSNKRHTHDFCVTELKPFKRVSKCFNKWEELFERHRLISPSHQVLAFQGYMAFFSSSLYRFPFLQQVEQGFVARIVGRTFNLTSNTVIMPDECVGEGVCDKERVRKRAWRRNSKTKVCVYKSTSLNKRSCLPPQFYKTIPHMHTYRGLLKIKERNIHTHTHTREIRKGNKMETWDIKCGSECIK